MRIVAMEKNLIEQVHEIFVMTLLGMFCNNSSFYKNNDKKKFLVLGEEPNGDINGIVTAAE